MSATPFSSSVPGAACSWRQALAQRYDQVRAHTLALAAPLSAEDQGVQSMADASPTKWHLAHTAWFFETLVLLPHDVGHRPFDERFLRLFNSYYESLGPRHPRPQRGMLSRPALAEVHAYRAYVDAAMRNFIANADDARWQAAAPLVELGLNHEQQHQELILTDILHLLSCNPLLPAYAPHEPPSLRLATPPAAMNWLECAGGVVQVGHGEDSFAFDNETPRHSVLLQPYRIADRLVSCADYAQFIADGGYRNPAHWLSDGWAAVQAGGWQHPA